MGLFDAIGSALGVAGSSLVGPAFSAASGLLGNVMAGQRQDSANEFSASQYASRYQTTVKDMQAAGLNPMLAYTQGVGNAPSSAIAQSQMPDIGSSFTQSKIVSAQEANLAAQTRKTNAEAFVTEEYGIKQAEANYQSTLTSIGLSSAQIHKVTAETDNAVAQLKNIKLESERLIKATHLLQEQSNLAFQQQLSETQRYDMLKSQARMFAAQAGLYNIDLEVADKLENSGQIGKALKPYFDMIRSVMRK